MQLFLLPWHLPNNIHEINPIFKTTLDDYNDVVSAYDKEPIGTGLPPLLLHCLNTLLQYVPNNEALLLRRSFYYEANKQIIEAEADLLAILNTRPDSKNALLAWTHIYQSNQDRNPLALLRSYLEKKPCYVDFLVARYPFYVKINQIDSALADLNALMVDEEFSQQSFWHDKYLEALHQRSSIFYTQNRFDDALSDLNLLINPKDRRTGRGLLNFAMRGIIYYQKQDYEKALSDLSTCIYHNRPMFEFGEQVQSLFYLRSTIYKEKGDSFNEIEDLNQVLGEFPYQVEFPYQAEALERRSALFYQKYLEDKKAAESFQRHHVNSITLSSAQPCTFFKTNSEQTTSLIPSQEVDTVRKALSSLAINPVVPPAPLSLKLTISSKRKRFLIDSDDRSSESQKPGPMGLFPNPMP
jgi:tetratricopeptide (TPR) repeat protein